MHNGKRPTEMTLALLMCALLVPMAAASERGEFMVGVKVYEYKGDFESLVASWKRVGVNTVFLSAELASRAELMSLARQQGIKTFIIFPVFQNAEKLASNPDLFALTGTGRKAEDDWVKFVCPNRDEYRSERLAYARDLIEKCQPDGLSIDFIRYFVFWEKVFPGVRLDPLDYACFCPTCLKKFQAEAHVTIPRDLNLVSDQARWILREHKPEWISWKCRTITSMVREIADEARKIKPSIKLNLHLVPWRGSDFDQGIRSVAGQDVPALASIVDMLSPMCYAHMVKQNPSWISSVVTEVARRGKKPVVPSVQVKEAYLKEKLTVEEFTRYLEEVQKPPSAGVIFWNWPMLAEDAEKAARVAAMRTAPGAGRGDRSPKLDP